MIKLNFYVPNKIKKILDAKCKGCEILNSRRKRLIQVHRCRGITRRTIKHFFRYDPTLKKIFSLTPSQLSQQFFLPNHNAQLFYSDLHHHEQTAILNKQLSKYHTLTILDENYPYVLKHVKDPPIVLYALGDLSLLFHRPALSVIGTRNPSLEAEGKMELIVKPLIENNWMIISGMAIGIDSYSHKLTLKHAGKTIAVLGGGFEHIYPKQNMQLFHQIAMDGLVLTEYPPDVRPERYHFPERNRIISGLSYGTLVIEAMEKSGTMITVDQALDQGREVYAVPGSLLIPQTKGCHQMIQDGAKLVLSAQDILDDWSLYGNNLFNT